MKVSRITSIFILVIIFSVALAIYSKLFIKSSIEKVNNGGKIEYQEIGSIDYKVFLKENDYYTEEYLGKDMKYIASLIDKIVIDFKYELSASEELNYNYTYNVTENLVIADKNNSVKVLYERPGTLVKDVKKEIDYNKMTVTESIEIDYDTYNSYVNNFKRDYSLSINSDLNVMMNIDVEGDYDFKSNNELKISIPLSEQTIDITLDTKELNNVGHIQSNEYRIARIELFIMGIFTAVAAIASVGVALYIYLKKDQNEYEKTIKKILKEYDRIIVNSSSIDEIDYETVVEVETFDELVDAHDTTEEPILYIEVIPNQKSYFLIVSDETLYKYTVEERKENVKKS